MKNRGTYWLKTPGPVIFQAREVVGHGLHAHVTVGRKRMSSADTRVSVIVGVCQQDPDRWREFDAIYRPILFGYVSRRGLNGSEANDVVQDIFVKLFRKIGTYDRARCRFRTWLFGVAHHTLVDHARRKASYKRAIDGWAAHVLEATPTDSAEMEREFQKLHREKILAHALTVARMRVSSNAWTCFERRLLRGHPATAIAVELKIEPNVVYVNACRVMKLVRGMCEEFDEDISHAFDRDVSG
jgi:RNA polymerase sigma-70 factor (ECF subfamily)